jgi:hypothetical protein
MSEDAPKPESKPRARRFWLTVGEVVAVLGLVLAGLGYWENRRQAEQAQRQEAQKAQAQTRSVFVMRGQVDEDGERVLLQPTDPGQVVQTQRYFFPTPVRDRGKEIGAGQLQIDLAWFGDGLKGALKAAREAGAPLPEGEARLPVGVVTTYVENGQTRTDQSLYRVGYLAEPGLFSAVKLKLLGATLVRRNVKGDIQSAVNAAWRAEAPKGEAAN